MIPSVQVLLSTYNGTRYLADLVESVIAQRDVTVGLLARDDGSTDDTASVLQQYTSLGVDSHIGPNVGAARSFLWLLERSSPKYDFVAFADQDDVWLPDKLSRAAAVLAPFGDTPAMYCSRLNVVDSDLQPLGKSNRIRRGPSFQNALVQNIATGCTIVLNYSARALLVAHLPETVCMHDWWVYQAISGIGKVIVDEESHILYRQHDANVVGAEGRGWRRLRRPWRRFSSAKLRLRPPVQLRELERCFHELWTPEQLKLVRRLIDSSEDASARLRLVAGRSVVFQERWRDLAYRALLLTGRV